MKRVKVIILTTLIALCFTGCQFLSNTLEYDRTTKEFMKALLIEDYSKCVNYFAMQHEMAKGTNLDTMKKGLAVFREVIVENFGDKLEYSFMNSQKKFSTDDNESTPANTTVVQIQISNHKEFGVLKVLFDDTSKKILKINSLDIKEPVPSMSFFWLFGLITLCVPIFNIYVIRQIKRSRLKKKWLKYVAIFFFNVPAVTYNVVTGLVFNLLSFQVLLGISFELMGYLNSAWTFGFPLGGMYWLWKLRQEGVTPDEDQQAVTDESRFSSSDFVLNESREAANN